jgi:hypothetical protein
MILVTLIEGNRSSETSVLTRATRHNTAKDGIPHTTLLWAQIFAHNILGGL